MDRLGTGCPGGWVHCDDDRRAPMLSADVGVDRLGVATILLLSRPERERLHLAIRRELEHREA
jgi:hypothetical protein